MAFGWGHSGIVAQLSGRGTLVGMIVDLPKVDPPEMPRRFGLRMMFVAITLLAVVLGLCVLLAR